MVVNISHVMKRNILFGVTAIAVAANIPVVDQTLSKLLNFSIGGMVNVITLFSIAGLFALWKLYNRSL